MNHTIVCDCGSTKAAWWIDGEQITTVGVNPTVMSLETLIEALPTLPAADELWFYGAGCTPQASPLMRQALATKSGMSQEAIHVESDMLGAARAMCQDEEGIVAILGTGANSCLYDGQKIVQQTPALGFILGDEGSGAVLGRTLVTQLYKGILPAQLKQQFEAETGLTQASIIYNVYKAPAPNRFLASLVPFISRHREELHNLLHEAFTLFVLRNLMPYHRTDLPVHFVGGVANAFTAELHEALHALRFNAGRISGQILEDLARFHTKK